MNLFLTLLIAALAGISSFIPATGKVFDNRRARLLDKIQLRGWLTIVSIGVLISLTALQNYLNDKNARAKEEQALKVQLRRDMAQKRLYDSSLINIKKKFDSSNINTVLTVTKTLGIYGYKLDSSNNKLVKIIKDSSNTKYTSADNPILTICPGLDSNSLSPAIRQNESKYYIYQVHLCSVDAGSSFFNINLKVYTSDSTNTIQYVNQLKGLEQEDQIPKDMWNISTFRIPKSFRFTHIIVHLKGSYKTIDGTKPFVVNQVHYYNTSNKTNGDLTGEARKKILIFSAATEKGGRFGNYIFPKPIP